MHTYKDYGQDPVGIKEQVIKSCRYLLLPVVRFVLRHDPGGAIAFAPLAGETARALLPEGQSTVEASDAEVIA